jgi:catechol 2,3-dioxygenase-like lactoylglutathione lyase family enzyme
VSDTAPNLAWGHININVSDLDQSITFYELLGFEMYRPAIPYLGLKAEAGPTEVSGGAARALGLRTGVTGRGCVMQLGRGFPKLDLIELAVDAQEKPLTNADIGVVRICLSSRNLQAEYASLGDQGVTFLSEPQVTQDGMANIAICVDPDGTLIEIIQADQDKWPSLPASAGGRG